MIVHRHAARITPDSRNKQRGRESRQECSGAGLRNTGTLPIPRVEDGNAGSRVIFHVARDQNEIESQRGCRDL